MPRSRRARRRLATAAALGLVCLLALGGSASAFRYLQPKFQWPGSPAVVKYHLASPSVADAVRKAASAWNRSGVDVHFRKVSRNRADLLIRATRQLPCGNGFAPTSISGGRPVAAQILLGIGRQSNILSTARECKYVQILTAAHEMGHTLSLDHEPRKCAVMNAVQHAEVGADEINRNRPRGVSPSRCEDSGPDRWYCRILSPDDLRGAARRYGGNPKVKKREFCPVPK